MYNIFTNVECEPSPIIELNDPMPSTESTMVLLLTQQIQQIYLSTVNILQEGFDKLTKLNNLLRKPSKDIDNVYHPDM